VKRTKAKIAMTVAAAAVVLGIVGSASASTVCVNLTTTVQGKTVTVHRCVTH